MPRGYARKTRTLIAAAHEILAEIQPATVRAVCYRLFTRGYLKNMSKNETNRVSRALVAARKQGIIPWRWVVDETREAERAPSWGSPEEFAEAVRRSYRRDRWQYQPRRVEIWSEKGTVRGTLAPILNEYGITFRVMHGYSSATTLHEVARETAGLDEPLLALYVGDWDPSGLHMSDADLPARLAEYGARVELRRVALAWNDVYRSATGLTPRGALPAFPASTKRGDPRYRWYVARFGPLCWELDALNPVVLRERVAEHIEAEIDWHAWEACGRVERAELDSLTQVLHAWQGQAAVRRSVF
jgi:hypothetical protein